MATTAAPTAAPTAAANNNTALVLPPPPRASVLQYTAISDSSQQPRLYWDRSHYASPADQVVALTASATVYVGNVSFATRSSHVMHHFASLGPVKRCIMGLDRMRQTPCGFWFVEYASRRHALAAVALLSGTKLDGKVIRVELDAGFQPGRQYGRGVSGGQVRYDKRVVGDKRRRSEGDTTHPSTTRPVTLDGALPSARNETEYYGPPKEPTEATDGMDDDDTAAPPAKRLKTERSSV